jgi:peroxiredoxin
MKLVVRASVAVFAVAAVVALGYVVFEKQMTGGFVQAASLEVGKPLPDFTLTDSTGKQHKLADYKGKILVVNFSSPNCPFSKGADAAINALAEKYKDKDVAFLGIDSNKNVTVEDLNKHIAASKQPYPIAKDPENKYADAVGAKVTPELFIVGKDGNVAYHGAPDNRTSPDGEPTEQYADAALKALTEGKAVEKTEVAAWGCGIKRVK